MTRAKPINRTYEPRPLAQLARKFLSHGQIGDMMVAIAALGDQNRRNDVVNDFVGVTPILHGTTEDVVT